MAFILFIAFIVFLFFFTKRWFTGDYYDSKDRGIDFYKHKMGKIEAPMQDLEYLIGNIIVFLLKFFVISIIIGIIFLIFPS